MENNVNNIIVKLSGRIDSANAANVEQGILNKLAGKTSVSVELDASDLEYISSAGLRVILRLKKTYPDLKITNVIPEVYEILEMTGFTEMMDVSKAYRVVSVEGCEVIGEGFNGKVYRIDKDNVVKTYKNADALSEIQHEREVARLALILGVPTAISYDVVRVGDSYGSVFELLDARSFAKILAEEPEQMDWCVKQYTDILKKIHAIVVPEGKLPSKKQKTLMSVKRVKDCLPDGLGDKLLKMTEDIPESNNMIHGDCHTKNIVLAGDEVLLIDMDTLCVGHPVFEFLHMYNAYVGYSEYDPGIVLDFQGFDSDIAREFWHKSLAAYLGTADEKAITDVENKVRCLSYAYLIDWASRHPGNDRKKTDATVALWKSRLIELLKITDSLTFDTDCGERAAVGELDIEADNDNLDAVMDFINTRLDAAGCPKKAKMQINLAVEEIFVNIASYAYGDGKGNVCLSVDINDDPASAEITFSDSGVEYDPLKKQDPDVTLPAEEREIGGLGIFLTKEIMDEVRYEYKDGKNILKIKKIF